MGRTDHVRLVCDQPMDTWIVSGFLALANDVALSIHVQMKMTDYLSLFYRDLGMELLGCPVSF